MRKAVMMTIVLLMVSATVRAAGYEMETARMEGGRKFEELQLSSSLNTGALAPRLKEDFSRITPAKCNAEARDYSKLTVKAPPAMEAGDADNGGSSWVLAGLAILFAAVPLLALAAGTSFAALSPAATVAMLVAGVLALAAATGYNPDVPEHQEAGTDVPAADASGQPETIKEKI